MDYKVENTGYNDAQVSEGYIHLNIKDFEDTIHIDVTEVTSSSGHKVFMCLNFNGENKTHIKKVLELIEADESDNYRITDETFVEELFFQYGSNKS